MTPPVIGLLGALVGALLGLSGVWWANWYQAIRAERQYRRTVYTDFLQSP